MIEVEIDLFTGWLADIEADCHQRGAWLNDLFYRSVWDDKAAEVSDQAWGRVRD